MSKKAKKGEKDAAPKAVSVAAHPRARASVRRTRAVTAIAAFAIVLLLARGAGVPDQEAVVRALLAGLAGNLIGWACALAVWRRLVVAEVRAAELARRERIRVAAEARAQAS
jgi:hypothetical protein